MEKFVWQMQKAAIKTCIANYRLCAWKLKGIFVVLQLNPAVETDKRQIVAMANNIDSLRLNLLKHKEFNTALLNNQMFNAVAVKKPTN